MWKIAGHTLGTPGMSVPAAMRLFKEAGLDGAEIIWQDGYDSGIPEDDGGVTRAAVDRARIELDLPVIGLTPYMSGINSLDEAERLADLARFQRCICDASFLGAKVVRVYAGAYTPDQIEMRPLMWDQLVLSLKALGPVALDADVTLVVENHFNTMTMSAAESVKLTEAVDHPAVGILYDQANLTFTHCEPYTQAIPLQDGYIRHVHVKDMVFTDPDRPFSASSVATVRGSERAVRSCVVGDGVLEWASIIASLEQHRYDGALSLEYEYRWHPQDLPEPAEGFRRGANELRRLMGATA